MPLPDIKYTDCQKSCTTLLIVIFSETLMAFGNNEMRMNRQIISSISNEIIVQSVVAEFTKMLKKKQKKKKNDFYPKIKSLGFPYKLWLFYCDGKNID